MASYNKTILLGNLTRDPEMSYLPNNTPIVKIGLAVNHKYKDSSGNQQEKVCFIDCKMFGKRAESLNQYVRKGDPLLVEGRLELEQWQDREGGNRSKHTILIETFTFMGDRSAKQAQRQQPAQPVPQPSYDEPMPSDEEIPF